MPRPEPANRSNAAYEELRVGILSGRWAADTRLSTYRLAVELGMSRTPVIEALKRLQADGLIEIIPQVGCRVLSGGQDIGEVFLIWSALEGVAAETAAGRVTEEDLGRLELELAAGEAALDVQDTAAFEESSRAFHAKVVRISGLAHVERILEGLWTLNRAQVATGGVLASDLAKSVVDHRAILAALSSGDPEAARTATQEHLRRCGHMYLAHVAAGQGRD